MHYQLYHEILLVQVMTATNIISTLVKAMGPGSVKHVKTLVPAVIATLGDSKVWVPILCCI